MCGHGEAWDEAGKALDGAFAHGYAMERRSLAFEEAWPEVMDGLITQSLAQLQADDTGGPAAQDARLEKALAKYTAS